MSNSEIGTYMIPTNGDENLRRRIRELRGEGHSLKETADILGVRLQKVTPLKGNVTMATKRYAGVKLDILMHEKRRDPFIQISSFGKFVKVRIRNEDINWICRELQAAKKGYEEFEKVSDEIMEED